MYKVNEDVSVNELAMEIKKLENIIKVFEDAKKLKDDNFESIRIFTNIPEFVKNQEQILSLVKQILADLYIKKEIA